MKKSSFPKRVMRQIYHFEILMPSDYIILAVLGSSQFDVNGDGSSF
jgi:hypothetical protein